MRPRLVQLGRLIALGLPAAIHVTLEVGVFAAATTLTGMLDPVALAAHHVVLDIASVTFMIPLGLASAGALYVTSGLLFALLFFKRISDVYPQATFAGRVQASVCNRWP